MAEPIAPAPPVLPDLEPLVVPDGGPLDEAGLADALVEHAGRTPVPAPKLHVERSELRGLPLAAGRSTTFVLRDTRLHDCDLSNVSARRGEIRRAEVLASRLVGFELADGEVQDLRVDGGTLLLASFARATLKRVSFTGVNLREATFLDAECDSVVFDGCDLAGADFRGARMNRCVIRGSSLDVVIGVESLRGVALPWADLVGSVAALADALGITVEEPPQPG